METFGNFLKWLSQLEGSDAMFATVGVIGVGVLFFGAISLAYDVWYAKCKKEDK